MIVAFQHNDQDANLALLSTRRASHADLDCIRVLEVTIQNGKGLEFKSCGVMVGYVADATSGLLVPMPQWITSFH